VQEEEKEEEAEHRGGDLPQEEEEKEEVMLRLGLTIATAAMLVMPGSAAAATFTSTQDENGNGITFTGGPANQGSVYPSSIAAPAGTVNDVNVTLSFQHDFPDDLDVALVAPNGTAVMLMSDACGDDSVPRILTFDDAAAQGLPDVLDCDGASPFDPSNFDGGVDEIDFFPPPGPSGLPGETPVPLSSFTGGPSGGSWQLFAVDDFNASDGLIVQWTLTLDFTPAPPAPTPNTPVTTPTTTPATPAPTGCKKKKKKKRSAGAAACKKKKKKK
jgi:subtilisin-like proprotein convertase family protein